MKASKLALAAATALGIAFSSSASAGIVGWFDKVNVAMVDNAYGWVCDNFYPSQTPLDGYLSVYLNGNHYRDYSLDQVWGSSRPDTTSMCGLGFSASGFQIMDWFYQAPGDAMTIYFHHNDGTLQQLGNTIILQGPGDNY